MAEYVFVDGGGDHFLHVRIISDQVWLGTRHKLQADGEVVYRAKTDKVALSQFMLQRQASPKMTIDLQARGDRWIESRLHSRPHSYLIAVVDATGENVANSPCVLLEGQEWQQLLQLLAPAENSASRPCFGLG